MRPKKCWLTQRNGVSWCSLRVQTHRDLIHRRIDSQEHTGREKLWIAKNHFTWTRSLACLREWPFTPFKSRKLRESAHNSHSQQCVLVYQFTVPLLGHSDVIKIGLTGTDGEPIHMNKKYHAVDKLPTTAVLHIPCIVLITRKYEQFMLK